MVLPVINAGCHTDDGIGYLLLHGGLLVGQDGGIFLLQCLKCGRLLCQLGLRILHLRLGQHLVLHIDLVILVFLLQHGLLGL